MNSKELLKDLISFNTINDQDNQKMIDYIEKYLKKIGFKTEYKTKCLVMSNKDDCELGFLGHTDTVSYSQNWKTSPFELTEINGNLYGLGTSDMKGSIAAFLSTVSKIDWNKMKKGIKVYFTYDEEIGFSGVNELVKQETIFPNYMIIGEPTCNKIINASKGLLEIKITFEGIASHSSTPEEGVNAIEKSITFIQKLQKYYKILQKEILDSRKITMNVGVIKGGTTMNIVPDKCEVFIDFRTITKIQNKKIINKISQLLDFGDSFEIINNIEPFSNNDEKIIMSDFITEASLINAYKKYILGVGPVNAHKKDEFISIESLKKLEEQYYSLIEEKCK